MAHLQVNFMSEALMRTVTVQVILPTDKLLPPGAPKRPLRPYKTLYLLNGVMGNHTDWCNATDIQILAEEKNLAVVMPGGENRFYLDFEPTHELYGEFVGNELVWATRKMFPLSHKREDTFIAGVSMGGYGALRNGLKYSSNFGYIAGMSAAAILYDLDKRTDDHPMFLERRSFAETIFGDFSKVMESDKNPVWSAKQLKENNREIPEIYLTVGREDFLYRNNRKLCEEFNELGLDVTFKETEGGHSWDLWKESIKDVLDWLPLAGDSEEGLNSGNIGL